MTGVIKLKDWGVVTVADEETVYHEVEVEVRCNQR